MKKITEALRKAIINAIDQNGYADWKGMIIHDVRFEYRNVVYKVDENEDGTYRLWQLPYEGAYEFDLVNPSFELDYDH